MGQIIGLNLTCPGYLAAARFAGKNAFVFRRPGQKDTARHPRGRKFRARLGKKWKLPEKLTGQEAGDQLFNLPGFL
jgi:hypothetical protein